MAATKPDYLQTIVESEAQGDIKGAIVANWLRYFKVNVPSAAKRAE